MPRATSYGILLAAILAPAALGALPPPVSWFKPGVSYADFKADSLRCGLSGYNKDVSGTEAAHVFKQASSALASNEADLRNGGSEEQMNTVATSARIVEGTRPEERLKEVHDFQIDAVSTCLRQQGYQRFQLSVEQQKKLSRLHRGSEERRSYIFSLATQKHDPLPTP